MDDNPLQIKSNKEESNTTGQLNKCFIIFIWFQGKEQKEYKEPNDLKSEEKIVTDDTNDLTEEKIETDDKNDLTDESKENNNGEFQMENKESDETMCAKQEDTNQVENET